MRIANGHGGVNLYRHGCWFSYDVKQVNTGISSYLGSGGYDNEL